MNTLLQKTVALSIFMSSALYADVTSIASEQDFQDKVVNSGKPTVVVFSASWCGACQVVHDPFKELSNELGDVAFAEVDIDAVPALKNRFVQQGVPTFVFFDSGTMKNSFVGALDKEELRQALQAGFVAAPASAADDMNMPTAPTQSTGFFASIGNLFAGIICKIKAIFAYMWGKIAGLFGR